VQLAMSAKGQKRTSGRVSDLACARDGIVSREKFRAERRTRPNIGPN
jgi:hypothetical protein